MLSFYLFAIWQPWSAYCSNHGIPMLQGTRRVLLCCCTSMVQLPTTITYWLIDWLHLVGLYAARGEAPLSDVARYIVATINSVINSILQRSGGGGLEYCPRGHVSSLLFLIFSRNSQNRSAYYTEMDRPAEGTCTAAVQGGGACEPFRLTKGVRRHLTYTAVSRLLLFVLAYIYRHIHATTTVSNCCTFTVYLDSEPLDVLTAHSYFIFVKMNNNSLHYWCIAFFSVSKLCFPRHVINRNPNKSIIQSNVLST